MLNHFSLTGCLKLSAKLLVKMTKSYTWFVVAVVVFVVIAVGVIPVYASGQSGEYLNYQEPKSSGSSWLSSLAYVITLVVIFLLVIGLAYFTSRFLGQKMGKVTAGADTRIVLTLPLGPNRALHVVEIAGKFLVLGVTDHSINLIQEITSEDQIIKLQLLKPVMSDNHFDTIFQRHLASLQHMTDKFPGVFGNYNRSDNENEREKR